MMVLDTSHRDFRGLGYLHLLLIALLFEVSGVLSGGHFLSNDIFSSQARGCLINNKLNIYTQYI